jgi:predicted phage tail protein
MWFYMIAVFFFFVGVIGGVASGGIFTLIFIPLGAVMLVVAVMVGMAGRGAQGAAEGSNPSQSTEPEPLRHTRPQGTPAPSTPEQLTDARRAQQ